MKKANIRMLVIVGLLVLMSILTSSWWIYATSAVDVNDKTPVNFIVNPGDGVRDITSALKNSGLIHDSVIFFVQIKLKRADNKIQAGDFWLNKSMTTNQIINELSHGTQDIWVTLIEGWRKEEIAQELNKTLQVSIDEFTDVAQEGYLFPDTYLIPKGATAGAILPILSANFEKKVDAEIKSNIVKQGLTVDQGIILASIVEKEGWTDIDRPIIAGILIKRFENNWPLQADATLQYILGYDDVEKTWWRKNLFTADKKIFSPYNTYLNTGFPPKPICNPGLVSIESVANPKVTDYWYYLHDDQGVAYYAKTLSEHEANIQKYLN